MFDLQPSAEPPRIIRLALGTPAGSDATQWSSAATTVRRRGGTQWRLRARSSTRPRLRIKLTIGPSGTLRGHLSAPGLRNVRFEATPSTCSDGFVDTGAGEECDGGEGCAPDCEPTLADELPIATGALNAAIVALAVRPDDSVIGLAALGYGQDYPAFLFRVLADGSRDASFGTAGRADTGLSLPATVYIQADGRMLVAGKSTLKRFDADGAPDETFGDAGTVVFPENVIVSRFARDDGRIPIVVGDALSRLLPNGDVDPEIGTSRWSRCPTWATRCSARTAGGRASPAARSIRTGDS